jgi:hypothetical protein
MPVTEQAEFQHHKSLSHNMKHILTLADRLQTMLMPKCAAQREKQFWTDATGRARCSTARLSDKYAILAEIVRYFAKSLPPHWTPTLSNAP